MILLSRVADTPDWDDTDCPVCQASVPVPCVDRIDTRESLDRLLAGTLNTSPCPSCGSTVISEHPVYIDLPESGIPFLIYMPLSLLEHDSVCKELYNNGRYRLVSYSLDELARQVRARLRLQNFQPISRQAKLPL
jgi:hypothetical protein